MDTKARLESLLDDALLSREATIMTMEKAARNYAATCESHSAGLISDEVMAVCTQLHQLSERTAAANLAAVERVAERIKAVIA